MVIKKQLKEKLDSPEVDRTPAWFWRKYIKPMITQAHFMRMLAGDVPMRDDVKKAIKAYLES